MIDQQAHSATGEVSPERVRRIVDKHASERGVVIAVLQDIQSEFGYLPETALRVVAEETKRPLVDIWNVATFYHAFSLQPRGRHLVSACLGTACHVRGGPTVVEEFERQLGTAVGGTTADREFTLKSVNCLGACALGPVAVVDDRYFSKMTRSKVRRLLDDARQGFDRLDAAKDPRVFPIEVSCPTCTHSLMDASFEIKNRPAIQVAAAFGGTRGWFRLSSLYGTHEVHSEHEIPVDSVAEFSCPHCHAALISSWRCSNCDAPMAAMTVQGGGTVRFCSRSGCVSPGSQMLDVS
jgi:NADH-quinone oxidoreductase subunit E